jgi:hypothetical protein
MQGRYLLNAPAQSLDRQLNGRLARLWTALPGIVQSFDAQKQTVVVQPAVRAVTFDINGEPTSVALPLLVDCPVQFPAGGGFTLTFPVKGGDECLMVFASRCIDAWWQSGGVQNQAVLRMHNLSDGFALLGFRSVPRAISGVSTSATQLRTDDGATFVEVGDGEVTIKAAQINLQGPVAQTGGAATFDTSVTAPALGGTTSITVAGKDVGGHTHTDPQGGTVGPMQG